MPAISVGSVEVDVIPNASGILGRLQSALVPPATQVGDEIGRIIGQRLAAHIAPAVRDGINDGAKAAKPAATRQGADTGGAFARSLRAKLQEAFRSMPKLNVSLSDTGVDADLARLRARMEALSNKTVGIDIDAATARAQAADIEERLRRIGAAHPNVAVRADTARAIASLQALQAQIDEVTADPARIRVETDGTFGQRLRAQVQAAEASLPNINITADSTDVDVEIARLRAQLTSLRDVRIGVDMDAATATARIDAIQARLQRLAASDADVAVRVDASAAAAQLATMQALVNRLDGQTATVNVRVSGMQLLVTAGLALGPALIPVLPVIAAGLGAIAAAGVAAAAGVGAVGLVALPALKGIGTALQAQKAAQDAATNATYQGGAASGQGAKQASAAAGAQQSLASAHRNAARQIGQAEQAVGDAVRNSAEANRRATEQVVQAKRGLADAVQQAADQQREAAERVIDAEDSLADAQRTARQAQQDLTQARRDAKAELAELGDRLTSAQLSERDATLSVQEAQNRLNAVRAKGAAAGSLELQRAQLAYEQSVQRLKEQKAETKGLAAEKKAADKSGVEGSATVRDAQERLADADRAVTDQQKELTKARGEQQRAAVKGAQDIADAQARVAESQRNVTRTQEDGARSVARAQESLSAARQSAAESIASAQRQVAASSMSAAGGMDQAAIAQAKYQAELAKLTPSARDTFNAFIDLRKVFGEWSKSLQPAVMPLFTRALVGLKNALPGLTPLVKGAADAIGGLQDRASRGFKKPWWKEFKADLDTSVGPAITGLGGAFGNVFKGMAGVIGAFLPRMDDISGSMQRITGRFADWGQGLKGSPEFERFLSYSSEMAPRLGEFLGNIGGALLSIGQALSPVSGPLLALLGGVAEAIGIIAEHAPWLVQGIWLAIVAWRIWTIALWAWNAAMLANPITLIIIGIVALIAGIVYAYNRFGWFRAGVQAVWNWLKTATLWLWNVVLKPTFTAIGNVVMWLWQTIIKPYIGFMITYWKLVGSVVMWLWNNAIKPAFNFIAAAAKILFTAVVVIALLPLIAIFKIVAAVAMWLWNVAIKPAFEGIAALAMWLWNSVIKPYVGFIISYWKLVAKVAMWLWKNAIAPVFAGIGNIISWWWTNVVKRYFGYVRTALGVLGDVFKWLWQKAVKPVWNGISAAISSVWRNGIKPVFDSLKAAVGRVGDAFESARKAIKTAWDRLKKIAREPVQYIVDVVYNNGIRGVWNKVAGAFGAKKLDRFSFASGGIMPGYTPGRDVHKFVSPTGGALELSGGEAIMRPEFTKGVGSGAVNWLNSVASSRGAQGIKAALAPVLGGNPVGSTDTSLRYAKGGITQSFADGGIFGWIGGAANKVAGAGSAAWNKIKEGADWLKDTLAGSVQAGLKSVVNPLLKSFPGMDTGFGKMLRRIPTAMISKLTGYSKDADKKGGGGGLGGPRIQAALKWVKTQAGLPYQWAGNGNPSWDCSGLTSAAESVLRGQKPHRRWATMAFSGKTAPPGWVYHGNSPYKIGITNAGVGHTAGTLGKTNIESRGGDGVVVGSRARGYNDRLFNSWYGFKPGTYDSGGYIPPGLNLVHNGTGRPEPVFTTAQANALMSMAGRDTAPSLGDLKVLVQVGDEPIHSIARAEIRDSQNRLIQILDAS
ncbi:hypothetical protein [Streptomyces ortus]|uniref:NlpC/P60 domain-containing protein n=1 Tax=Streptomyces ortus TaxID=2867268 RepID=A0ABT3UWV3_9ACTN|nr:hypothetical protein [Streptomyces ortus]MCX4231987.1 hypothetical protein [Streptomyces ortus]